MSETGTAPSEETAALAYLRTGSGEPWRWTDSGETLVWVPTGGTVVFRAELLVILEALAPGGLPPFPALALLLAALRGYVPFLDDIVGPAEMPPALPRPAEAQLMMARTVLRQRCEDILKRLRGLQSFPRDLLTHARAKALLADAVFERAGGTRKHPPEQAREIVAGLRRGVLTEAELVRSTGLRLAYLPALQALKGLATLDAPTLAMRLRTGLDADLSPAPLPPEAFQPPALLARQTLESLSRGDPAHAALARAARDLLAALSLPRRLPEPDDQATSGAADVANRGSLDKLLLSELANDDLTLATRVALNEALYLRHEPPAAPRAVPIALLLDVGVRMWGVPRVFATAAALALGAADARRPGVRAWRADDSRIEPVDLLSTEGVRTHLGALTAAAHPGEALPAFFEASGQGANLPPGHRAARRPETEAVILTHRDTLADPAFRRALDAQRLPPCVELFVGTVDRDGRFELVSYPQLGKAPVCAATIRLEDILQPAKPAKSPLLPALSSPSAPPRPATDLPVILSLPQFPFLLSVREKIDAVCEAPGGRTIAVGGRRKLFSWHQPSRGADLVAAGLPPGRVLLLQAGLGSDLAYLLKHGRKGRVPLTVYGGADRSVRTVWLAASRQPLAARVENGVVLFFYRASAEAFRLEDGEKLQMIEGPSMVQWSRGRYYRSPSPGLGTNFFFVTWDGLAVNFTSVATGRRDIVAIFDRTGPPGPWILTTKGEVCHLETGERIYTFGQPPVRDSLIEISGDGHHARITTKSQQTGQQVDLKKGAGRKYMLPTNHPQMPLENYGPLEPAPQCAPMVHFSAVCILPSGALALRSRKGKWRVFTRLKSGNFRLEWSGEAAEWNQRARPFVPVRLPEKRSYTLREARWPDGSRAFLDSRGFLHLKSVHPPLEISLALTEDVSAIWSSDARMAGADFFIGPDRPQVALDDLLDALKEFCTRTR